METFGATNRYDAVDFEINGIFQSSSVILDQSIGPSYVII